MYFLDGHVHLQHPEVFVHLLDAGLHNMGVHARRQQEPSGRISGLLLIAGLPAQQWLQTMVQLADSDKPLKGQHLWKVQSTQEDQSILCRNEAGDTLCCALGEQVNTTERLELLLFGANHPYEVRSLEESVEQSLGEGALVIVPWGVGKWLGNRGKAVSRLLQNHHIQGYCLGDNGNRPQVWARVPQFAEAAQRSIPLVTGSDPLFLDGEIARVGNYGTIVRESLDLQNPLASLRNVIQQGTASLQPYGQRQPLWTFLSTQFKLRLAR